MGLICLLTFTIRLNFIHIPFERDEGAYAYYGQLVLDGKIPYLGFYETKPPGMYYIYALLQLIFGTTVEALHFSGIFLNLVTIVLIFTIGQKLMDTFSGLISAASFGLLSLAENIAGFTVQAEHTVIFFSVAGIWLLLTGLEKSTWIYFFLSGALIGTSVMIKQNAVFFMAFSILAIVARYALQRPLHAGMLIKNGTFFSAGIAAIATSFVAVMAMQGALSAFWKWVYVMAKVYSSQVSLKQGADYFWEEFIRFFHNDPVLIIIAGGGCVLVTCSHMPVFNKAFILCLLLFSFIAICPGLWFYKHYFILMTPSLGLCVGSAFYTARILLARKVKSASAFSVLAIAFILVVIQNLNAEQSYYFRPDYTRILREVYGMNPFPEAWEISSEIRKRTSPGEVIGILGGEPEVFVYTGTRGPSVHDMAIMQYGTAGVRTQEWEKAYIADVEKAKPRYLICFNNPLSLMTDVTDPALFQWFQDYTAKNYRLEGIADMISPLETNYLWDGHLDNYSIQSPERVVLVFRRRDS